MAEQGITQGVLADKINVSRSSLNRKLKSGQFTLEEIERIRVALGLSEKDMAEIVFTENPPKSTENTVTNRHNMSHILTSESVEK